MLHILHKSLVHHLDWLHVKIPHRTINIMPSSYKPSQAATKLVFENVSHGRWFLSSFNSNMHPEIQCMKDPRLKPEEVVTLEFIPKGPGHIIPS